MTRSTTKTKNPVARTISCRVDDELHAALQHYCQVNPSHYTQVCPVS